MARGPHVRAIGERMHRAKSPAALTEATNDWATAWYKDQSELIRLLERGTRTMDRDILASAVGQLKVVTEKRFVGLDAVLRRLLQDQT